MFRLFILSVFIATVAIPRSSKAQEDSAPTVRLYSSVGIAVPIASKTFRRHYDVGPGFNEGLLIRLMDPLSLRTTFTYHWYDFRRHSPYQSGEFIPPKNRISANTVGFNTDFIFNAYKLNSPDFRKQFACVYSVIGVNFMSFKSGGDEFASQQLESFRSNTFGVNAGAGLRYFLNRQIQFYGELDYQINFEKTGTRELLPISLGVSLYLN